MISFKKLFLSVAFAIGVTFVASAQKIERVEQVETTVDYMESSARYLEPSQTIMTTPMIADLKVMGGQISYTETEAFKDVEVTEGILDLIPTFKKIALCHAARAHKADMIIGALVDVITNANHRLEITITGYPACYVNFRNATADDLELVKKGYATVVSGSSDVLNNPDEKAEIHEKKKEIKKTVK